MMKLEIVIPPSWKNLPYLAALKMQNELNASGRAGWLFFSTPPTVTLGSRARREHLLNTKGLEVLEVDRGGEVTFHGPGQIVGFPFGTLEAHVGDSRGVRVFIERLQEKISKFILSKNSKLSEVENCKEGAPTGLWVEGGKKICAFGMRFARDGIAHGFALNVTRDEAGTAWGFDRIVACGDLDGKPAFIFDAPCTDAEFELLMGALGREIVSP